MPIVVKQPSKQEIKNVLRQVRGELKHKYGVRRIGLFGSVVREDEHIVRDVDLLVEFERRVGLLFIHLAYYLEEILGRPVDLVTLSNKRKFMCLRVKM